MLKHSTVPQKGNKLMVLLYKRLLYEQTESRCTWINLKNTMLNKESCIRICIYNTIYINLKMLRKIVYYLNYLMDILIY